MEKALGSIRSLREAEKRELRYGSFYAENWVYAPAVQKEREVLEKTGGQILWLHGQESHSGSHSRLLWRLVLLRGRINYGEIGSSHDGGSLSEIC